jgi:hypothetical protein
MADVYNPKSKALQGEAPPRYRPGDQTKPVGDLRDDIDDGLVRFEAREGYPMLTRITGGSTALSLAGLPTAKALVGTDLLQGKAKASLVLNEGTTAELTFTSNRPGTPGNDITVAIVDSAAGGLAVSVLGTDIEIDLGGATPDAATIKAALDADADILNLVSTADDGVAGAGLPGVSAQANLAGGTGSGFECLVNGIDQKLNGEVTDTAVPMLVDDLTGAANLDEAAVYVKTNGVTTPMLQVAVAT